jgi:hypothetical protein
VRKKSGRLVPGTVVIACSGFAQQAGRSSLNNSGAIFDINMISELAFDSYPWHPATTVAAVATNLLQGLLIRPVLSDAIPECLTCG